MPNLSRYTTGPVSRSTSWVGNGSAKNSIANGSTPRWGTSVIASAVMRTSCIMSLPSGWRCLYVFVLSRGMVSKDHGQEKTGARGQSRRDRQEWTAGADPRSRPLRAGADYLHRQQAVAHRDRDLSEAFRRQHHGMA